MITYGQAFLIITGIIIIIAIIETIVVLTLVELIKRIIRRYKK